MSDPRYQGYVKHKLSNMMTFANNEEAFFRGIWDREDSNQG